MIELVGGDYAKGRDFRLHFCEWPQPGIRIPMEDAVAAIEALARAHGLNVRIRPEKGHSVQRKAGVARWANKTAAERSAHSAKMHQARRDKKLARNAGGVESHEHRPREASDRQAPRGP